MEARNNASKSTIFDTILEDYFDDAPIGEWMTVLNDKRRKIFEIVNFMVICDIVGLFGIIANVVNMIVFYKQGFSITVNIAFFGLAISDLCCLISLVWSSICMNPLLPLSHIPWIPFDVMYLLAAMPHVGFCRITSYITVYITAERLFCIVFPMKVKQLVTTSRTALIIILIYLANFLILVPEYATSYLGWAFVPSRNKTLLTIIFTSSRMNVEGVSYIVHSVLSALSFVGVIIITCTLVIKLRQSSKLRQKITSGHEQKGYISSRDQKTVKMIVLIAIVLIVCYTPGAFIAMATFVIGPEFSIKGRFVDMFEATWSTACSFQSINSSINIIFYYKMSSRYRHTLHSVFLNRATESKSLRKCIFLT